MATEQRLCCLQKGQWPKSWQFEEKEGDYEKMWEEKEGVMRNAMTTRAPGGAKKTIEAKDKTSR